MTNTETDQIRERMTDEEFNSVYPLTVAEIDEQIKALKAQKRKLNKTPRTPQPKKQTPVKHQRKIICSYCGKPDSRNNMERISRYEYQHPICMYNKPTRTVRIDFKL